MYYNREGAIIYIGKAKNIKKRVSSYFTKNQLYNRVHKLTREISDIQYTIVNSEWDALLLERNLIKKNQPKYNILLKDGKNYPYICITREPFPLVFPAYQIRNKKHTYYGPYANIRMMYAFLDLFKQLYTIRTCSYNLSEENINTKKYKVCLEYHIKNCKAPCIGLQTKSDYHADIDQIEDILKGNIQIAKKYFKDKIREAAKNMEYELAHEIKKKYEIVQEFQHRSTIVNPKISNLEVYTIISNSQQAYINFFKVIEGAIIQAKNIQVTKKLGESIEEILLFAILDCREKSPEFASKIISNIPLSIEWKKVTFSVPKIGDLKKLVDLSLKNALFFKNHVEREKAIKQGNQRKDLTLLQLKADLNLVELPRRIECFDNSNLQGTHPVATMVSFKDGKPVKNQYRKFHIKSVKGINDFSSIYEVVMRRYKRLCHEKKTLPNLILIDGGKGQVSFAYKALKDLNIHKQVVVIGIAKRLEEIYFPNFSLPLHINKRSNSLMLLQKIRDEAHRFAITFHRGIRNKYNLKTILEKIPGIGEVSTKKLLKTYRSMKLIKESPIEKLAKVVGQKKAEIVFSFLSLK